MPHKELISIELIDREAIGIKRVLINVERYKARLVAKRFTQKESIDYHETFSPISKKDLFRIIMTLVIHFELELQQMDMKTTFLTEDFKKKMYMA